jgi:phosphohistidine phosphatase
MKTLHLLRHAKSSRTDDSLDDHARPLASRGRRNAKTMGRFLSGQEIELDRVRCSTARRAVQTWRRLAPAMPPAIEEILDEALYLANRDELLELVRRESDAVASLLLVGHNPGLAELALALCSDDPEPDLQRIAAKFPTGAYAAIALDCDAWRDVRPGCGRLLAFQVPRDLR